VDRYLDQEKIVYTTLKKSVYRKTLSQAFVSINGSIWFSKLCLFVQDTLLWNIFVVCTETGLENHCHLLSTWPENRRATRDGRRNSCGGGNMFTQSWIKTWI